jgi:ABC-type sugar transport system substrate-binding protein
MHAQDDSITQSQQLLEILPSGSVTLPAAFLVEPVTRTGLPRAAEAGIVFTVTQGQHEIGRIQGKQFAALLPQGGSVLYIEGPSASSVAIQRHEGVEDATPRNVQLSTSRSKWSEEGACQSAAAWLRLATSRTEKFDLVAAQTHELALGARKASQNIDNEEQKKKWLELPFIGIGISNHVKPLVEGRVLTAAVFTSVTMELALRLLVGAFQTQVQPPERSIVEASSFPDLEKTGGEAIKRFLIDDDETALARYHCDARILIQSPSRTGLGAPPPRSDQRNRF